MNVGAQLRTSREGRGLSLEALARAIRVQPRMLAAIEQNDASAIPPRPFGRGFVHAYAREVGLDPHRAVRDYFGQFAGSSSEIESSHSPVQSGRSAIRFHPRLATIAVIVGVIAAGAILLSRTRASARLDQGAVGTTGVAAPAHPAPQTAALPGTASQAIGSSAAPSRAAIAPHAISIELAASSLCWVTARADERRVVYQLLKAGDHATVQANHDAVIIAGDAAALTWTVNGRSIGTFGAPGVVRTVTVTPANAAKIR